MEGSFRSYLATTKECFTFYSIGFIAEVKLENCLFFIYSFSKGSGSNFSRNFCKSESTDTIGKKLNQYLRYRVSKGSDFYNWFLLKLYRLDRRTISSLSGHKSKDCLFLYCLAHQLISVSQSLNSVPLFSEASSNQTWLYQWCHLAYEILLGLLGPMIFSFGARPKHLCHSRQRSMHMSMRAFSLLLLFSYWVLWTAINEINTSALI